MPLYKVKIQETAIYEVTVMAPNKTAAEDLAERAFLASITCDYPTEVTEREAIEVKLKRKRRSK